MTTTAWPRLTISVWVAGIIARWRLALIVTGLTLLAAGIAVLVLPPVYQARTSFIPPMSTGAAAASAMAMQGDSRGRASQLGVGSIGKQSESPGFYVKLLESEELRGRLLHSTFENPRGRSATDSATLLEILDIRNDDARRREEIARKRLSRAMSTVFDARSNLIQLTVKLSWPDVSAAVANKAIVIVDEFQHEQRVARARARRVFIEQRVDSAGAELQQAEARQRFFYDQNREWRASPDLVSEQARLSRIAAITGGRFLTLTRQLEAARLEEFNDASVITVIDPAVAPRKAIWPRYGILLANAVLVAFILGMLVAGAATVIADSRRRISDRDATRIEAWATVQLPESAGGASSGETDPERSFLSSVAFPLFAWGLAFHSLVIAALFGWFGLPEGVVRAIAAWKEVALALLCGVVIVRAVTGRGPRTVIDPADLWVGGLIATAVLFLLTENLWLRFDLPRAAEFIGIRDTVYFMLAYFVGRGMPELVSNEKTMRRIFILIVVTCAIGVAERIFVTPELLVGLGVASYFQNFLSVSAFTVGNDYGLPLNYWTMIGGHLFRRAGSVYLSGQGFAVPFLLFFPLATTWVFFRPKPSAAQIAAYAIVSAGLLLTLTRMTIAVALVQLVLFASLRKRPEWAVAGITIMSAVVVAAFLTIPGFPAFVWQTLSWQEGSSVSHVNDWVQGLTVFGEHPWGSGLGTTDQTAVRAGLVPLTGDNLYFKYAVEMGVAGLGFLIFIIGAVSIAAMRLYERGATLAEQRMGITLLLAAIGIAINGGTAVVFNSITLGWLFFWLAGAAITVSQRLPTRSAVRAGRSPNAISDGRALSSQLDLAAP